MKKLIIKELCSELSSKEIEDIARESGFQKRVAKKISSEDYLSFFCQESIKGTVSYNDLAAKISCDNNCDASRQAYFYRTKKEAIDFFKKILEQIILKKTNTKTVSNSTNRFKRILIQDSTIIKLPKKLYEIFSGVSNGNSVVCNARIQGIYDIISKTFIKFSICKYSQNDLSVANDIDIKNGDLVLRDRGYYVTSIMANMKAMGADSIMRYKHKTTFYDVNTLKKIDLLQTLKKLGNIDMCVLTGFNKTVKLRILAAPVPEKVVNTRRMKAKKEARNTCTNEYLQLLGWSIFITTIEDESFSVKQAYMLYSLRWRIECIFKTWKSDLSFDKIHSVSEKQLKVLLYARLIMITLFFHNIFNPLQKIIFEECNKKVSLMKLIRFLIRNLVKFIELYNNKKCIAIKQVTRYCTYDNRKRINFMQNADMVLNIYKN